MAHYKTCNLDLLRQGSSSWDHSFLQSVDLVVIITPVLRFQAVFHLHLSYHLRSAQTFTATADVLAPLSCCQVGSISIYACAILPFVFNIKSFCFGWVISLCILAFPISETIKWFQEVSKSTSKTA